MLIWHPESGCTRAWLVCVSALGLFFISMMLYEALTLCLAGTRPREELTHRLPSYLQTQTNCKL